LEKLDFQVAQRFFELFALAPHPGSELNERGTNVGVDRLSVPVEYSPVSAG
jgi:hypothetical protein